MAPTTVHITPRFSRAVRARRSGITLLEILISIFVVSVGLLGIAALIPVGQNDADSATAADMGSAVGRAAFRHAKTAGQLDPGMWINYRNQPYGYYYDQDDPNFIFGSDSEDPCAPFAIVVRDPNDDPVLDSGGNPIPLPPINGGNSICIDPLFITANAASISGSGQPWQGGAFPYFLENEANGTAFTAPIPRMQRVSVRRWNHPDALGIPYGMADRTWRSGDDLTFEKPEIAELRPRAVLSGDQSLALSEGEYTWLMTVTPTATGPQMDSAAHRQFFVSVVVFRQRDLAPAAYDVANRFTPVPSEQVVNVDFRSGRGVPMGSGAAQLWMQPLTGRTAPDDDPFATLRANQWIMLSAWRTDALVGSPRAEFRWFRVAHVSDNPNPDGGPMLDFPTVGSTAWVRDVTLAGGEWHADPDPTIGPFFAGPELQTTFATLVDGVVAVYEKTIRLETTP